VAVVKNIDLTLVIFKLAAESMAKCNPCDWGIWHYALYCRLH